MALVDAGRSARHETKARSRRVRHPRYTKSARSTSIWFGSSSFKLDTEKQAALSTARTARRLRSPFGAVACHVKAQELRTRVSLSRVTRWRSRPARAAGTRLPSTCSSTFPEGDITDASDSPASRPAPRSRRAPRFNATFAAPLVVTNYINDFLELLRPQTLDRQDPRTPSRSVQRVDARPDGRRNIQVGRSGQDEARHERSVRVRHAGEGQGSGIIVLTEELVRLSTPSAEAAVRDELVKGAGAISSMAVRRFHRRRSREREPGLDHQRRRRYAASAATMARREPTSRRVSLRWPRSDTRSPSSSS
jgi:hypothetical protein